MACRSRAAEAMKEEYLFTHHTIPARDCCMVSITVTHIKKTGDRSVYTGHHPKFSVCCKFLVMFLLALGNELLLFLHNHGKTELVPSITTVLFSQRNTISVRLSPKKTQASPVHCYIPGCSLLKLVLPSDSIALYPQAKPPLLLPLVTPFNLFLKNA